MQSVLSFGYCLNSIFFSEAQHQIPPDSVESATASSLLKRRMARGYIIVIVLSLYLAVIAVVNDDLSDTARYVCYYPFACSLRWVLMTKVHSMHE
jgi:chlorite dismutase